jgi:hypothetical protein
MPILSELERKILVLELSNYIALSLIPAVDVEKYEMDIRKI